MNAGNPDTSSSSDSLKKKVLEQENTIKSLNAKLQSISETREKLALSSNGNFRTPAKTKNILTETSAKKPYSFWDNFGSTPSKEVKVTKHLNESSTFDDSDEKLRSLQQKLKQVCQELECQRHNSEASKNAMEQRLKEKEHALKTEVKQLAQTISDQDRELKEFRNKYQQDVVQANKKLDVANMQLQRSDLLKQQVEKDLKTLESQVNSKNLLLCQKDDELKDIQKQKNGIEATTKSLQSEKRELERNCTTLQADKKSQNEEIRNLKFQLDGSNNLVKEKETILQNIKKERECALKLNSELQMKIQSANKDLSIIQSEKYKLEKQLLELDANFLAAKENIETLKSDKKNCSNLLDLEKSKSNKLETDLVEKKKELLAIQSQMKSIEQNSTKLETELEELKISSSAKVNSFEQELSRNKEENFQLKSQIETCSDKERIMKENILQIEKENDRISGLLLNKASESEDLSQKIEKMESQLLSLQNDNEFKNKNISNMMEEIKSLTESKQNTIQEFESIVANLTAEISSLRKQLNDLTAKEVSLNENLETLDKENRRISNLLDSSTSDKQAAEFKVEEMKSRLATLQSDIDSKAKTIDGLKKDLSSSKDSYDLKILDAQQTLSTLQAEKNAVDTQVQNLSTEKCVMEKSITQEKSRSAKLEESLQVEIENAKNLEMNIDEIKANLQLLQSELIEEKESFKKLELQFATSKVSYEKQLFELKECIGVLKSEKISIEAQLNECISRENKLKDSLKNLETEKLNLTSSLAAEKKKIEICNSNLEQTKISQNSLQNELSIKDAKMSELDETITTLKGERKSIEDKLNQCVDDKETLQKNLLLVETEKNLSDRLFAEQNQAKILESDLEELRKNFCNLQEELQKKETIIVDLNNNHGEIKVSYEKKLSEVHESIAVLKVEKLDIEKQLKETILREEALQKNLLLIEQENQSNLDMLEREQSKIKVCESELEKIKQQQVENIQDELDSNETLIKEINSLKIFYEIQINELQNKVDECTLKEVSLVEKIKLVEDEKAKMEESLNSEKNKSEFLESSINQLSAKVENLETELCSTNEVINSFNSGIESCKEDYKLRLKELENAISGLKLENENLSNQMQVTTMNGINLQHRINMLETDKSSLTVLLSTETETTKVLKSQIEELKSEMLKCSSEILLKDDTICALTSEMEEFREIFETGKVSYATYIASVQSGLLKAQESALEVSARSEVIEKEIHAIKEGYLVKEADNKVIKLEFLHGLLNQVDSIERITEVMTENYEYKISELEKCYELAKYEVSSLQNELDKHVMQETELKETLVDMKLRDDKISYLILQEKELRASISTLLENMSNKDQLIQQLESELEAMKNIYEDKNTAFIGAIQDLESNLRSALEDFKKAYVKSGVLENEMKSLKDEYQKFQMQSAENQQIQEKFALDLLNQLDSIENEACTISNNYEESIDGLQKQLCQANVESSQISSRYFILLAEKSKFEEIVSISQKEIKKLREDLGDTTVIQTENAILLKQIEILQEQNFEIVCEHEKEAADLKELHQESLDKLKYQLSETHADEKDVLSSRLDTLLAKNSQLKEWLEYREIENKNVLNGKIELENFLCFLNNENQRLYVQKEEMAKIYQHLMMILKHEHRKLIDNLKSKLINARMEKDKLSVKCCTLLDEKSELEGHLEYHKIETKKVLNTLNKKVELDSLLCILNNENQSLYVQKEEMVKLYEFLIAHLKQKYQDLENQLVQANTNKSELNSRYNDLLVDKSNFELLFIKSQEEMETLKESSKKTSPLTVADLSAEIDKLCVQNVDTIAIYEKRLLDLKLQHQDQISSLSDELKATEERLSFIDSQFKAILSTSQNFLSCLQMEQDQNMENVDEIQVSHDHCYTKNSSGEKEIKEMCSSILHSMTLITKHFTHQNTVKIPLEVAKMGNDYFQFNTTNCWNKNVTYNISDDQEVTTKLVLGIRSLSIMLWNQFCTLEENILLQKEHFKFLLSQQLIDDSDYKKMFLLLKFLKKTHNEISKRKSALVPLKSIENSLMFSQSYLCGEYFSIINSLTNDCSAGDIHEFFEKSLLVNSYRNIYMMSKFKKALHSLNRQLNASRHLFEKSFKSFKYQDIYCDNSHMPAIISSAYVVYVHNVGRLSYKNPFFEVDCVTEQLKHVFCSSRVLNSVPVAKVPLILNSVYKLSTNSLFSYSDGSHLSNLIYFVLEMLIASYKKETSSLGANTLKILEKFLILLSESDHSHLKEENFPSGCMGWSEALFSLLHDLRSSLMDNEHYLLEESSKVSKVELECKNKQQELMTLYAALAVEKERLKGLNVHIESTQDRLNAALLEKEDFKSKVIEVSKACNALKMVFSGNYDISKLQTEVQNFSSTLCLCQECLPCGKINHDKKNVFSLMSLFHDMTQLFTSKVNYEKEVHDLKKNESDLKTNIELLENEKSILEETLKDLEEVKCMADEELENFKLKYESLNNEYKSGQVSLLESGTMQENLLKSIEIYKEDIKKCKNDYSALLTEHQNLEHYLAEKKNEISLFEKSIEEKTSESKVLSKKCNQYEQDIDKLNETIAKLLGDINQSKENISQDISVTMDELKTKIVSLEKSNSLLNETLENVEDELQNIYAEKQKVQEELQVRLNEVQHLQLEIQTWKSEVTEEKKRVSSTESRLKELEEFHQDADKKYSELLFKSVNLEKDITHLKSEQKDHKVVLLEKNFCLKQKDLMISQLKEKIENSKEKENFELCLAEIVSNYNNELNAKSKFVEDLDRKINIAGKEKLELEEKIQILFSENANLKMLQGIENSKLNCEVLTSENTSLKDELKKMMEEKTKIEFDLKNFKDKMISTEKEITLLHENFHTKREKYTKLIKTLEEDLYCEKQSNADYCVLIQDLQKRANDLEKEISKNEQATKEKMEELSFKNSEFQEKINKLNSKADHVCECQNICNLNTQGLFTENDYKHFIKESNSLLCDALRNITRNSDCDKKKYLLSMLTDNSTFSANVYEDLRSFLTIQFTKQEDFELKILDMVKSISNSIMKMGKYCKCFDESIQTNLFSELNKTCLDASVLVASNETGTEFSFRNLTDELKNNLTVLERCFKVMKDSISMKEREINSLRKSLNEPKTKLPAPQDPIQTTDAKSLENVVSLLKTNAHRLEKKHNKLLKLCKEMEARIQQLEKENSELEAEAKEMVCIINNQNVSETISEESMDTYMQLANASRELEKLRGENTWLISALEQCKVMLKDQITDCSDREQDVNKQGQSSSDKR